MQVHPFVPLDRRPCTFLLVDKKVLNCFQWDYGLSERAGALVDGVIKCRGRREIEDVTVTGGNGDGDFLSLNEDYYLFLASGSGGNQGIDSSNKCPALKEYIIYKLLNGNVQCTCVHVIFVMA